MALHFPIQVNGRPIANVYIVRIAGGTHPEDLNIYDWEVFPVNKDAIPGHETVLARGRLSHRYGDGALELSRAVLNHYHDKVSS